MKCAAIAFAFTLTAAGAAEAGDWRRVAAGDTAVVGVDISSIVSSGDRRTVWQVAVRDRTATSGEDYSTYRVTYDCRTASQTLLAVAHYSMDGRMIDSLTIRTPTSDTVFPDSVGYGVLETVCGRREPQSDVTFDTAFEFARIQRIIFEGSGG